MTLRTFEEIFHNSRLPMARLYARYFGGNLEMVSMHGRCGGVDAYLLVGVGTD